MSNDRVISKGRFKGRKIEFASTERIDEFARIADEFMEEIFELQAGEYLISDESDVCDFTEMGSADDSEIWKRIKRRFGLDKSDVGPGRFVNIFAEIARRRNVQ